MHTIRIESGKIAQYFVMALLACHDDKSLEMCALCQVQAVQQWLASVLTDKTTHGLQTLILADHFHNKCIFCVKANLG